MSQTYSTTKVCSYQVPDRCDLSLDPGNFKYLLIQTGLLDVFEMILHFAWSTIADLVKILAKSRNEEELRHVWTEWHDKSGKPIKEKYKQFVALNNEAAKLNGNFLLARRWNCIYTKEIINQHWIIIRFCRWWCILVERIWIRHFQRGRRTALVNDETPLRATTRVR